MALDISTNQKISITKLTNNGRSIKYIADKNKLPYREVEAYVNDFNSLANYNNHRARERQKKPENIILSYLIIKRLAEKKKSLNWLARQIGITKGAVFRYTTGETTPRKSLQEPLFEALNIPYKSLDDLMENNQ